MKKHSDSFFENLDDETVEEISNAVNGMDDNMKERVFEKCRQKMGEKYSRTEKIKVCRPRKFYSSKILTTAAGLVIVAGLSCAAVYISGGLKNKAIDLESFTTATEKTSLAENSDIQKDAATDEKMYDEKTNVSGNAESVPENDVNEIRDGNTEMQSYEQQSSREEPDIVQIEDYEPIAEELIEKYYKAYTAVLYGFVGYNSDDYITPDDPDRHYCRVTDSMYTSVADFDELLESCFTQNVIEKKRYREALYGQYSKYIESDGALYVLEKPSSWPVNLLEIPCLIEDADTESFTAIKQYDNFGMIEKIVFKIVNTEDGWKIDSYEGEYENGIQ